MRSVMSPSRASDVEFVANLAHENPQKRLRWRFAEFCQRECDKRYENKVCAREISGCAHAWRGCRSIRDPMRMSAGFSVLTCDGYTLLSSAASTDVSA